MDHDNFCHTHVYVIMSAIMCSISQGSSISILSLLLFMGTAVALLSSNHAATECSLPVKEFLTTVKGMEIESLMIPGCCEWPCSLRMNTTTSIIIEFHTSE